MGAGSLLMERGNEIVLLADADVAWGDLQALVLAERRQRRCRLGVGGVCTGVKDFPRSYREARFALRVQDLPSPATARWRSPISASTACWPTSATRPTSSFRADRPAPSSSTTDAGARSGSRRQPLPGGRPQLRGGHRRPDGPSQHAQVPTPGRIARSRATTWATPAFCSNLQLATLGLAHAARGARLAGPRPACKRRTTGRRVRAGDRRSRRPAPTPRWPGCACGAR